MVERLVASAGGRGVLMAVLLAATGWWLGAAPAGAAAIYQDTAAGVALPLPFAGPRVKTPGQVEALIREELAADSAKPSNALAEHEHERQQQQQDGAGGGAKSPADFGGLPKGAHLTSGVYADSGWPYVLIWSATQTEPVTLDDLAKPVASIAADVVPTIWDGWQIDAKGARAWGRARREDGTEGRLLVQLTEHGAVFVGYYFRAPGDAADFEQIRQGLRLTTVAPFKARAKGRTLPWRDGVGAVAFILTFCGVWIVQGRRTGEQRVRHGEEPGHGEAGQAASAGVQETGV